MSWIESIPTARREKLFGLIPTTSADRAREYAGEPAGEQDRAFVAWLMVLDHTCMAKLGLSFTDLPDQPFRDWHEADMTPAEALAELATAEGLIP
jgi:hypothetical protein